MVELVFLTCRLFDPSECLERELLFYDVSLMACMMGAQPVMAKWASENPVWQVYSWKCRTVQSAEVKA
ncbi:hypothetical protein ACSQ76_05970 [Roseovarius sp. B08]|uniref:hypothetical protein n=1 Tax=Roseovarius sp. B08 TaxID=3449223 RepID=UPI003EDBF483